MASNAVEDQAMRAVLDLPFNARLRERFGDLSDLLAPAAGGRIPV